MTTTQTPPPPIFSVSFGGKVAVQTAVVNAPTLSPLFLTTNTFLLGSTPGTTIGFVQGLTAGSMLFLTNSFAAAVDLIAPNVIQVGESVQSVVGTFNIQFVEILDGATNSPNISTVAINVITASPVIDTIAEIPMVPQIGDPITAIDATWFNGVISSSYQWQAAGINATGTGAATLTYTPVSGDLGDTLTITVIATNSNGPSAPSTSAPSAAVIATAPLPNLELPLDMSQAFPIM